LEFNNPINSWIILGGNPGAWISVGWLINFMITPNFFIQSIIQGTFKKEISSLILNFLYFQEYYLDLKKNELL
jgi:hypothetical protein